MESRLEGLSLSPNSEVAANDSNIKSGIVSSSVSPENSAPSSPPQMRENSAETADIETSSDSRDDVEEAHFVSRATGPALEAQAAEANIEGSVPLSSQANKAADNDLFAPASSCSSGSKRRFEKTPAQSSDSHDGPRLSTTVSNPPRTSAFSTLSRRPSFGLSFLSSLSNSIRGTSSSSQPPKQESSHHFMANSPTIANLSNFANGDNGVDTTLSNFTSSRLRNSENRSPDYARQDSLNHERSNPSESADIQASDFEASSESAARPATQPSVSRENTLAVASHVTRLADNNDSDKDDNGKDKDGSFSVRLTPIIDHSNSNTGLYFSPIIRRSQPSDSISVGRYTEKHKSAAHAPQGSNSRIVFKSKVVSRTHALFQCNEEGQWFLKDCKSSSGTFLNNIRLSQASQESTLWPLMDGDVVQLGLDYRGGTEEVYRCVKMRCEFNRSWQRKVNRFDMDIHKKMKNLGVESKTEDGEEFSECAICLLKLEPCQALFISPCSHSWHYKCIRPIIIKRYPQFYCPNCRSICDLETDIEDEDED